MEAMVCISFQIMVCTFFRSMKGFSQSGMGQEACGKELGLFEFALWKTQTPSCALRVPCSALKKVDIIGY